MRCARFVAHRLTLALLFACALSQPKPVTRRLQLRPLFSSPRLASSASGALLCTHPHSHTHSRRNGVENTQFQTRAARYERGREGGPRGQEDGAEPVGRCCHALTLPAAAVPRCLHLMWLRVCVGDAAVGKSSSVERFVKNEFFEFQQPTIGSALAQRSEQASSSQ